MSIDLVTNRFIRSQILGDTTLSGWVYLGIAPVFCRFWRILGGWVGGLGGLRDVLRKAHALRVHWLDRTIFCKSFYGSDLRRMPVQWPVGDIAMHHSDLRDLADETQRMAF